MLNSEHKHFEPSYCTDFCFIKYVSVKKDISQWQLHTKNVFIKENTKKCTNVCNSAPWYFMISFIGNCKNDLISNQIKTSWYQIKTKRIDLNSNWFDIISQCDLNVHSLSFFVVTHKQFMLRAQTHNTCH